MIEWFTWIHDPQAWIALATLALLEIVLGIDNIIFISILVGRLPEHQRNRARVIGLGLAMVSRILLLLSLAWVMTLTSPLFTVLAQEISGRDLILIVGGLFLLGKSVHEIHNSLEGEEEHVGAKAMASFGAILAQIAVIDIVFSLDSVITAVGMADHVAVMVIAVVIAVAVMMLAAKPIGEFVDDHPTIKMLALSFLILVGVALLGEGFDQHIPKGYIYFAMAFSFAVEILNLRMRKKAQDKVRLHRPIVEDGKHTEH
ncbi:TerC family protein [Marinobacter fonticola]|uniref:TerC family protein n=1 Tax=Marinobacter fonticola TaxID=2603215 RepID=UPI0011E6D66F|nr:TerC family protein [Marinobacter fonticola]